MSPSDGGAAPEASSKSRERPSAARPRSTSKGGKMDDLFANQTDLLIKESDDEQAGMGEEDGERPGKRKRVRRRAACIPCQRRKTRCNKQDPCDSCTRRNEGNVCEYDVQPLVGMPPAVVSEFAALRQRVSRLEDMLGAQLPMRDVMGTSPTSNSFRQPAGPAFALSNPSTYSDTPASQSSYPLPIPSDRLPGFSQDGGRPSQDAEEAAMALEHLAMGRSQYGGLGMSNVPCVGTPNSYEKPLPPVASTSRVKIGAYTTILRSAPCDPALDMNALLANVPDRSVSESLSEGFFAETGWFFCVLHRPTFVAECRELYEVRTTDLRNSIDPAWLATYFIVLAWSVVTQDFTRPRPYAISAFTETELRSLAGKFLSAGKTALDHSSWSTAPQVRVIQYMLLSAVFISPDNPRDQSANFYIFLGNPHKMPADDPAFPPGASSLKRELAKRLFWFALSFDWLNSLMSGGINQITPDSFDTNEMLEVDDDDLGRHVIVQERPSSYLSDLRFSKSKCLVSAFQMQASKLLQAHDPDYGAVLHLDNQLQAERAKLMQITDGLSPRRKPHHLPITQLLIANRIMRLHRPFLERGWRDQRYEQSSRSCLQAAGEIATLINSVRDVISYGHLWWTAAYAVGAALVLMMNLHHNVQQGAPINELVNQRDAVLKLRSFFANILSKRAATLAPQHNVASQTLSMIDALLAPVFPPGPMSRPAPPGSLPSLRDLLQTVAGKGLQPSSAGAPAAPQASTSAFDSLAYTPLTSRQGSVERYLGQDDLISSQANLLLPNMHTTHQQGTSMGEFDTMASTEALVGFLTGPTGYHDGASKASSLVTDWTNWSLFGGSQF